MSLYLSPKPEHFFRKPHVYGCIFNIRKQVGRQFDALEAGCKWLLDNNQFNDEWTWPAWWRWLNRLLPYQNNCLGIVPPDKLYSAALTIHLFRVYHGIPKEMGYPVAFVTQDGMSIDDVPWPLLDVLFVGGSNYHKRGKEAESLALEAKRLGKWVHIGRVQAGGTMLTHWPYADSFDGTTLVRDPNQQDESITNGILRIQRGNVPHNWKLEGI